MSPERIIRAASSDDVENLTRLIAAFRDFLGRDGPAENDIRKSMIAQLQNPDVAAVLAFSDGVPIGYAFVLFRYSHWANAIEATVNDLYVIERERGTGTGRELITHVLSVARSRGARLVTLSTNEMNTASNRIYESLGFTCYSNLWRGKQIYYRLSLPESGI